MAGFDHSSIVGSFPSVRHALAYGSAAFFQPGLYEDGKRPMLDLILVVDNPSSWHRLVCGLLPKSMQLLYLTPRQY